MRVLKFGGSSLGTTDGYKNVLNIINRNKTESPVVVVSALGSTTNDLVHLIRHSIETLSVSKELIHNIHDKQVKFVNTFVIATARGSCIKYIEAEILQLSKYLHGITLLQECPPKTRDAILSFGEKCSQSILTAALKSMELRVVTFPPGKLIRTNSHFGSAQVEHNQTLSLIHNALQNREDECITVLAGFLGMDDDGEITTLGRDGSDYTAGLIGKALNADIVEIWSDVDGILDGDPRLLPNAQLIHELHYHEAAEIAYFGTQVLHHNTIYPLETSQIPIVMKNTYNPNCPGTRITAMDNRHHKNIKLITSVQKVLFVKIKVAKPGRATIILSRFFDLLDHLKIRPFMVNQSSADASFSVAIAEKFQSPFRDEFHNMFMDEISLNHIILAKMIPDYCIVSAIGLAIADNPKNLSLFFSVLEEQEVSPVNISLGVSGHNISALVKAEDGERVVKAFHRHLITKTHKSETIL